VMAMLTFIPIDCWICGAHYQVPATISQRPSTDEMVMARPVSAHFWVNVDQTMIRAHIAAHWPMLVVGFFLWRAYVDVFGIDPLEYYR